MDILLIIPIILFLISCFAVYAFFSVFSQWKKETDKSWNKSYLQRTIGLGIACIGTLIASIVTFRIMYNSQSSGSNVQETTAATDELTTYQTTEINGTEYELVPRGEYNG